MVRRFFDTVLPVLVATSMGTGCACDQVVRLHNATNYTIQAQVALPWPSYAAPSKGTCHFEFFLPPNYSWATEQIDSEDKAEFDMKMVNGITLVRIRIKGSISSEYRTFSLERWTPVDATIQVNLDGKLDLLLSVPEREPWFAEQISLEYFKGHD